MNRLWILVAMAGLVSCTPKETKREVYSVLYDTTDPLLATPDSQSLWEYMDADMTDKDIVFRYASVSDVDISIRHQLKRPAVTSSLFSNAVQEKKRLDSFKKEFQALIETKDSMGAPYSTIFKPIVFELQYLAGLPKGNHKQLIVYSDLMENSDWLTFYSSRDLWLLEHDTSEIVQRYLTQVPKDTDFRGLSLTIVFIPKNFRENRLFKKLREVYTLVFQELDVSVSFSGNLVRSDSKQ